MHTSFASAHRPQVHRLLHHKCDKQTNPGLTQPTALHTLELTGVPVPETVIQIAGHFDRADKLREATQNLQALLWPVGRG